MQSYESIVHRHLLPRFAATPIAAIDYPCVLAFVAGLQRQGLGAGTVRNIRDVLRLVLGLAVRSGALKVNPVTHVEVSRTNRSEMIFLDPDQIMTLAEEVTAPPVRYRREERRRDGYPEYGLLVRFAAFTGLRAGELVALRAGRLDLMRRRVEVNESGSEAYGALQLVATKTYERRTVPIPASLIDELAQHLAGIAPDGFVWQSPQGESVAKRSVNLGRRNRLPSWQRRGPSSADGIDELASEWRTDRPNRQARRGLDPDDFDRLAEAGFLHVVVPEEMGGLWRSVAETTRPICEVLRTLAAAWILRRVGGLDASVGPRILARARTDAGQPGPSSERWWSALRPKANSGGRSRPSRAVAATFFEPSTGHTRRRTRRPLARRRLPHQR